MLEGKYSSFNEYLELKGYGSGKINNSIKSPNVEVVKNGIYSFLSKGYPAVIKVTRQKGGRHYVTAIGFKTNVTNPSQINENNILVLDNATGKITTLADSGNGNRRFYKEQNQYEVIGPNNKYLATLK